MWNIIEFNQIARGENVRLFTASGIIEGTYRGSEVVSEDDNTQWIQLTDVSLSPVRANVAPEEVLHLSDMNVQLSQIVALDLSAE